jgi:DNA-binding response OmpR family regulator
MALPLPNLFFWCVPMRILVAEDDAPLAEFLHQRLQQEQFSVHMVADGGEASVLLLTRLTTS